MRYLLTAGRFLIDRIFNEDMTLRSVQSKIFKGSHARFRSIHIVIRAD